MSSILNSASAGGTGASSSDPGSVKRGKFYHETVVFQVEDTLHRVLKQGLEQYSRSVFRDMFALPQGEVLNQEGATDENPIKLVGCTNSEFESLLEVVYPTRWGTPKLSKEQWIGVLRLSRMWDMPEVAALAIDQLTSCQLAAVEKISLGKAHGVPSWLKEGYTALVMDLRDTSLQDVSSLGWETAFRIVWARFKATDKQPSPDQSKTFCCFCNQYYGSREALSNFTIRCKRCGHPPNEYADQTLAHIAIPLSTSLPTEVSTQEAIQNVLEVFDEELKDAEARNA